MLLSREKVFDPVLRGIHAWNRNPGGKYAKWGLPRGGRYCNLGVLDQAHHHYWSPTHPYQGERIYLCDH
jgi:hypothetical protein